ncbi:MAG TPA: hypothetical protein VFH55_09665 [Nitrospiria bacterium]|nr:hypothetical protein [Nitrospiria bacterium]
MGFQFLKPILSFLNERGILMGILVAGCLLCSPVNLRAEQVAVIVKKDGPLTHLSKVDIRGIYLGEIRFSGGMPIRPVQYAEGHVKDVFLLGVVGLTSKDYKLYWVKKLFQEGLTPPIVKGDPAEIIGAVHEDPWTIGYVPKEFINGSPDVQIIYIIEDVQP